MSVVSAQHSTHACKCARGKYLGALVAAERAMLLKHNNDKMAILRHRNMSVKLHLKSFVPDTIFISETAQIKTDFTK